MLIGNDKSVETLGTHPNRSEQVCTDKCGSTLIVARSVGYSHWQRKQSLQG